MKNDAIQGINQIGKIGFVLTVIASVICYMFLIGAIGAALLIHNAPESLATISVNVEAVVDLDLEEANLESTAVKTLQGYLEEGAGASISMGSLVLFLNDYVSNGNGGHGVFGGEISSFSLQSMWRLVLYVCIILAATVIMLLFNGFFAKSLKECKTPFDEKLLKDANNFAIAIVIWSVVVAFTNAMIEGIFTANVKVGPSGLVVIVLSIGIFFFVRILKFASNYTQG